MRLITLYVLLALLIACSPTPPQAPSAAPDEARAVPSAEGATTGPESASPSTSSTSASVATSPQAGADAYLREAMHTAQQRYESAVEQCNQLPSADNCVSSATAALEQEQANARLEHQRQLEELHQGG